MTIKEKGEYMIDETQLDKGEAIIFTQLLICERERHVRESILANMKLRYTGLGESLQLHFWTSCEVRHEEDIAMINKIIFYLTQKFSLEG